MSAVNPRPTQPPNPYNGWYVQQPYVQQYPPQYYGSGGYNFNPGYVGYYTPQYVPAVNLAQYGISPYGVGMPQAYGPPYLAQYGISQTGVGMPPAIPQASQQQLPPGVNYEDWSRTQSFDQQSQDFLDWWKNQSPETQTRFILANNAGDQYTSYGLSELNMDQLRSRQPTAYNRYGQPIGTLRPVKYYGGGSGIFGTSSLPQYQSPRPTTQPTTNTPPTAGSSSPTSTAVRRPTSTISTSLPPGEMDKYGQLQPGTKKPGSSPQGQKFMDWGNTFKKKDKPTETSDNTEHRATFGLGQWKPW